MATCQYAPISTKYGTFDLHKLSQEEVAQRTGTIHIIKKKEEISTVSDVYAAVTRAKNDLGQIPALLKVLDRFPSDHILPKGNKPLSHLAMITSWELVVVAHNAAAAGSPSSKLSAKAEEIKKAVLTTFSSPSAYNRQRDIDVTSHAESDCRGCRFEGIRS
jgi:hypothetical protein